MNKYKYGTDVELTATFRNRTPALYNPTTVTLTTKTPAGVQTNYVYGTDAAVTRPSTGYYLTWIAPREVGVWKYRYTGTSSQSVTNWKEFEIEAVPFS